MRLRDFFQRDRALLVVYAVIVGSCAYFILTNDNHQELCELEQQSVRIHKEIAQLEQRNGELKASLTSVESHGAMVEKIAREELNLSRPNEKVFLILDAKTEQPQPDNH